MRRYLKIVTLLVATTVYADKSNMSLFPIDDYSQSTDMWISPSEPNYNTNLLDASYQQQRLQQLKHTYFGTGANDNSPWSRDYVEGILQQQNPDHNIANSILITLDQFDNTEQSAKNLYLGMNDRPYSNQWIEAIENNIDLDKLQHIKYSASNRAIATSNMLLRGLPTSDPAYYSSTIPGEGYPFDNLQASAIYAGTPLYILGSTVDHEWTLVLAPEYIGWVKTNGVSTTDNAFIQSWQKAAYANIAGIKTSNTSIVDQHNNYHFSGYVGMIFPVSHKTSDNIEILIPVKQADGKAIISRANLKADNAAVLPLAASPENFAMVIKALQGRQYGWGNLGFYNDCSAEMKAIFTMMGFFMPRNTRNQGLAGKVVDISKLSPKDRADYLIKNGDPLLTLVHLPGHIILYVGTYKQNGREFALSYQQMWGLSPKDRSSRSVIGKSVFLPLLSSYPENTDLDSQYDKSIFELIYLDQFPEKPLKPDLNQLLGE